MLVTFSKLGKFGRIGNSMFQIAATLGYALKHKRRTCFPFWEYGEEFSTKIYQNDLFFLLHPNLKTHHEPSFKYTEIPDCNEPLIDLVGYFQSEKYFVENKEDVLKFFQFSFKTRHPVFKHLTSMLNSSNEQRLVAVHIRRGDYLTLPDYHPVLPTAYYDEAIALVKQTSIRKDLIFLIFSDDPDYAEAIYGERPGFIVVKNTAPITDLYLQSLCNYHIIANSSFSWWGAYLAKSLMVITPGGKYPWFGPKGPTDSQDLIPSSWHKL